MRLPLTRLPVALAGVLASLVVAPAAAQEAAPALPPSPAESAAAPSPAASTPEAEARVAAFVRAKTGAEMSAALEALRKDGEAGAAALLGRLRAELARPVPRPEVVVRLRGALVKLGNLAAPLATAAFRNPEESIPLRTEAARIVSRIQGYRSVLALVEVLVDALDADPSPFAARLIEVLGDLGDPRPLPALERALEHNDATVRFAAATALGKLGDPAASPALLRALEDEDLAVRAAAHRALVRIAGTDRGFEPDAPAAERVAGIKRWTVWWETYQAKMKSPPAPTAAALWSRADEMLAWAVLGRPVPGLGAARKFPAPSPPANAPVILSTENLPNGLLPLVEGRKISLRSKNELSPVPPEGYWRFSVPKVSRSSADLTLARIAPGEAPRAATLRFVWGANGWQFSQVVEDDPVRPGVPISQSPSPTSTPRTTPQRTTLRPAPASSTRSATIRPAVTRRPPRPVFPPAYRGEFALPRIAAPPESRGFLIEEAPRPPDPSPVDENSANDGPPPADAPAPSPPSPTSGDNDSDA